VATRDNIFINSVQWPDNGGIEWGPQAAGRGQTLAFATPISAGKAEAPVCWGRSRPGNSVGARHFGSHRKGSLAGQKDYPRSSEAGCSLFSINENGAIGETGVLPSANHSMCAPPATNRNSSVG